MCRPQGRAPQMDKLAHGRESWSTVGEFATKSVAGNKTLVKSASTDQIVLETLVWVLESPGQTWEPG